MAAGGRDEEPLVFSLALGTGVSRRGAGACSAGASQGTRARARHAAPGVPSGAVPFQPRKCALRFKARRRRPIRSGVKLQILAIAENAAAEDRAASYQAANEKRVVRQLAAAGYLLIAVDSPRGELFARLTTAGARHLAALRGLV